MKKAAIHYVIDLNENHAHLFNVTMRVSGLTQGKFSLPTWTPGSYMQREFSQHIISLKTSNDQPITKLDKNTFEVVDYQKDLDISYQVYGFDSSIRAAFIDDSQAFFNGTALCLRPHEEASFNIEIKRPKKSWQVATALASLDVDSEGFGTYVAQSYDELVDHPFQISPMKKLEFSANGIPHEMVFVGDVRPFDEKRLTKDLAKLCETTQNMFSKTHFEKYLFIARFEENSYGGLEHRNSSMLLASPNSLPKVGMGEPDVNYRTFLSLCSHEYFHAWNVKRLKPKTFVPYDFDHENYTTMLWIFEGITAYYDDLLVKRANLISAESYLDLMSKNYTKLLRTPGRLVQSVADSSFDAWIKHYRPNENSPNCQVSYYLKGSFIALYLDLLIRKNTLGKKSLDDVMDVALTRFDQGISEDEFFSLLKEIGEIDASKIKNELVYGTKELPLFDVLKDFGVELELSEDDLWLDERKLSTFCGFKFRFDHSNALVTFVESNSPAMQAGLSPQDEILAINGIRFDAGNAMDLLGAFSKGQTQKILTARKKVLIEREITPASLPKTNCRLKLADKNACESWLDR